MDLGLLICTGFRVSVFMARRRTRSAPFTCVRPSTPCLQQHGSSFPSRRSATATSRTPKSQTLKPQTKILNTKSQSSKKISRPPYSVKNISIYIYIFLDRLWTFVVIFPESSGMIIYTNTAGQYTPKPYSNSSGPNMGVSENRGPQYGTPNSRILIIRTPK